MASTAYAWLISPTTALRTRRLVTAAPSGCYKLGLLLRGSAMLSQDGRQVALTPGDFTVYDTDRPYTLGFSSDHRMLILVFPRDLLRLPAELVGRLTATPLPGAQPGLAGLIPSFLTQVADVTGDHVGDRAVVSWRATCSTC